MATLRLIWQCMFSPKLYRMYGDGKLQGMSYEPSHLEKWGDRVIESISLMWGISLYTSPFIATFLYRRGYLLIDGAISMVKVLTGVGVIIAASYCMRGLARSQNPMYITFLTALQAAQRDLNKDTKKALSRYDFDFSAWPVEFKWSDIPSKETLHRLYVEQQQSRSMFERVVSLPLQLICYVVAHTFGIKLAYPGSSSILQMFLFEPLLQGRSKLVEENAASRYKLQTKDGNYIDSMFVDQRGKHLHGNTLVICCEGNAGFYEIGIMVTPIEAGYSVLGWNHPGFGGSTGVPFPDQETKGIDVVLQFAMNDLHFRPENIVIFGWSIGGYCASWAAMNYPEIKGVILDATFDDILPLALPIMPKSWGPLVRMTIRDYINLNIYEQLSKYPGPIHLIRRTEDEIICTDRSDPSSNRGNSLLLKLLKYRYPLIVDDETLPILNEWLRMDSEHYSSLWKKYNLNEDICTASLILYVNNHSNSYPMLISENYSSDKKISLCLFLANKYMSNFKSSHCTPLPANLFRLPWEILSDMEYLKFDML
ncbi:phosphatidylserine lipase ABHD16A [Hetaerina americana]|uniref:phosphatidylserine lipase ABHD16A n=1 Tax=Hetaerina americana TaxID=62018 RepID=UPI003A7F5F25